MQYENVFKVIGVVHIILAFLVLLLLLLKVLRRRLLRVLVLGSSGSSMSTHEHMAKTRHNNEHTCNQKLTLINSTKIHKNSTLN